VTVSTPGYYSLQSISVMDTFGYIYNDSFVSSAVSQNSIASNDDSAGNQQFRLYIWLNNMTTYVLVVTTYLPNITGAFSINAIGLKSIILPDTNTPGKSSTSFRVSFDGKRL
jgi:hypothetical protein